jgi:hypothetical protein
VLLPGSTNKTDAEIRQWIEKWVRAHPKYDVFTRDGGENCQSHVHAFYEYLSGSTFPFVPQAEAFQGGIGGAVMSNTANAVGGGTSGAVAGGVASALTATAFEEAGVIAGPGVAAAGSGIAAAQVAAAALPSGLASVPGGWVGRYAGQRMSEAYGATEATQAQVGAASGLTGAAGTGAAFGVLYGGPIGAAAGGAIGGAGYTLGQSAEYLIDKVRHYGFESNTGVLNIEGNLRHGDIIYFPKTSPEYEIGIDYIELRDPYSWQVLSSMQWNYTFAVHVHKKVMLEFWTQGNVEHDLIHCHLPREHTRRFWADTKDAATVIKIRVTGL